MLNHVDPLAQLEERYLHTVEVAGSSPVGITIFLQETTCLCGLWKYPEVRVFY
jgi:hypothetical protein